MNTHSVERLAERASASPALLDIRAILAGSSAGTSDRAARLQVRVISHAGVPRWVLPQDTRRAVAVLRTWAPYKLTSRLKWSAILTLCRLNGLAALPGATSEALDCDLTYWRERLPGFSDDWAIVAYIGNPSPTRKAILFFVDQGSKVRAVAKVPLLPEAKAAILNEANVLTRVGGRFPMPQVLFSDALEGIAAQTWMEGVNVSRSFGAEQLEMLTRLVLEDVRVRMADCRKDLEKRIAPVEMDSALLSRALALLDSKEELRACVEHGDFAPWNLRRLRDGRLGALDWEWAREVGFPWQDVCRYFYMRDYLFQERTNVWQKLMADPLLAEYRRRFELLDHAVRGLTAMYLLHGICVDHEDGMWDRVTYAQEKLREFI